MAYLKVVKPRFMRCNLTNVLWSTDLRHLDRFPAGTLLTMSGLLRGRGEHSPAMAAMFAARRELNKNAVIYVAGVLGCLIVLLAIIRLIAALTRRPRRNAQSSSAAKPFVYLSR